MLVLVILFVATWGGLIKCGSIPYFCDLYDLVLGSPRVAIVFGDSGLGNPEKLRELLLSPDTVNAQSVDLVHIDRVSQGNLKNYKLVIVEKARVLSFDQMKMFVDYVSGGGRLVWIGDAGVETIEDEQKNYNDVNELKGLVTNPWVRIKETVGEYEPLYFDEFLGLRYISNFCEEKPCNTNPFSVGAIKTEPTGNHTLIYGLSPILGLKVAKDRDFAIVKQFPNSSNSNIVLTLDFGGSLIGESGNLGKSFPLIVSSGVGERVAYYAYPPEYYVMDNNYYNLITRMYYGMLGRN